MDDVLIESCRNRIAVEDDLARTAPNPEAAELHAQKSRLYRTQLTILERGHGKPESL